MTPKKPAQGAARIGRRIGITLFWLMAVFIVVMSSRSVLGEIYGRSGASEATPEQQAACATALRTLEQSLREQAGQALRDKHDPKRVERWLSAWDHDYEAIGACGELEDARLSLGDLRARTATLLEQHARRSAPLTERIRRALLRFEQRSSTSHARET